MAINYNGKSACFAIRNNPKRALEDIRRLSAAVETLTAERAGLLAQNAALDQTITNACARIRELEDERQRLSDTVTDIETELARLRAGLP